MPPVRSVAILAAACAATAVLAACASNSPAPSALGTATIRPGASATTLPATAPSTATSPSATSPATTPTASAPLTTTPAPATTSPTAGCATEKGSEPPNSSITVCPAAGPVGSVVHVTIRGCAPGMPAAALAFLGPNSWLGTDGGGGANVPYSPRTGYQATATFTIPATYTGGNENGGPYPTLTVRPGTGYEFITDPAGECHVPFSVTAP
jgi:hypothetical protein